MHAWIRAWIRAWAYMLTQTYGADEAAEGGNALALHDGVTTLMYEGGQSIWSELLERFA